MPDSLTYTAQIKESKFNVKNVQNMVKIIHGEKTLLYVSLMLQTKTIKVTWYSMAFFTCLSSTHLFITKLLLIKQCTGATGEQHLIATNSLSDQLVIWPKINLGSVHDIIYIYNACPVHLP